LLAYSSRKCVIYFSQKEIDDHIDTHVDDDLEENRNG